MVIGNIQPAQNQHEHSRSKRMIAGDLDDVMPTQSGLVATIVFAEHLNPGFLVTTMRTTQAQGKAKAWRKLAIDFPFACFDPMQDQAQIAHDE
jgi:hypothetical protein